MSALRARVESYRKSLRNRLQTSQGTIDDREGCVFVLADAEGRIARGEGAPAYWLGAESVGEVRSVLDDVAAVVSTSSLSLADIEETFVFASGGKASNPRLDALRSRLARLPSARAAIDSACLESKALDSGTSVAEHLGGDSRLRLAVSALVAAQDEGMLAAIERRAVQGFQTVKIKVGELDPGAEIERLRRALRACEEFDLRLRVDANRAWATADARQILDAVAEAGAERIEFIEEPLCEADLSASADLRRATGVPLALDESLGDIQDVVRLAELGAMDVAVAKLARFGGPRDSLAAGEAAARFGVRMVFTDSIETQVGVAAVAHTAAAAAANDPNAPFALGLGGPVLLRSEGDVETRSPVFLTPGGPGFGVEPGHGGV
jgi:o-succinylbenzoate synthase